MKKLFVVLVLICFCFGQVTGFATIEKAAPKVYFCETYNNYATNIKPTIGSLFGKNLRVVSEDNDKALTTQLLDGYADIAYDLTAIEGDYSISFDLKFNDKKPKNTNVKIKDAQGKYLNLLSIDTDTATSYNGYRISKFREDVFQNVTIGCSSRFNARSIYVDGKCLIQNWKLKQADSVKPPVKIEFEFMDEENYEGSVSIDNVYVYGGSSYYNCNKFSKAAFNPEEKMFIPETEAIADTIYTNDNFNKSAILKFSPKDNVIERKMDEADPANGYVNFVQSGAQDMYADYTSMELTDAKFVVEFDIRSLKASGNTVLCLKDNSNQSGNVIRINCAGGTVVNSNGNKTLATIPMEQWSTLAVAINLRMNQFDLYVNHELKAEGCKMATEYTWDTMNMVRWYTGTNTQANFDLDNIKIYAGKALRDFGDVEIGAKSVLQYAKTAEIALAGSIAFHPDSDYVFTGNTREALENKTYTRSDGTFMVSIPDLEKAIKISGTADAQKGIYSLSDIEMPLEEKDGVLFVSLKEYAEKCGLTLSETKRGLITINKPIDTLTENLQDQMNDYMIYEHPTKEAIMEKMESYPMEHPFVLGSHEKYEYITANWQSIPDLKSYGDAIIAAADTLLIAPPATYNLIDDGQTKRLLQEARKVLSRTKSLGMAYLLTNDKKYSDRLYVELDAVMEFPDWHPAHYLDTAEMSMAFAIGYDWGYSAWTDEQKNKMKSKIFEQALDNHLEMIYGGGVSYTGNITSSTNRGFVNNAGCGVAAMAFYDANPEKCADIIANSIWGMDIPMRYFFPSGSWYEGPGYWSYALDYLADFVSTVQSLYGTDFGILKAKGFRNTGNFAIQVSGGGVNKFVNNFHDCGYGTVGNTKSLVMLWLSSVTKDQFLQNTCLEDRKGTPFSDGAAMIWYNLDAANSMEKAQPDLDAYISGDEFVSLRSSFADVNATVLMMHAGVGDGSHTHLDNGAFVIDMLGERWATDMGSENYGIPELNSKEKGRYFSYRVGPQGHNDMVFNPTTDYCGQDYDAFCPIERIESKARGSFAVADLSTAYKRDADSYKRGYKLSDDRRSVIIRDEVSLKQANSTAYWLCHTTANAEIVDNHTAILTINEKKVKVSFLTNATDCTLSFDDADYIEGFKEAKNPAETSRAIFKRLTLKMENAPKDLWVQTKFIPLNDPAADDAIDTVSIADWTVPDGEIREVPKLATLTISGFPNFPFSPDEAYYVITVDDINQLPQVLATAGEGVTVSYEWKDAVTMIVKAQKDDLTGKYTIAFHSPLVLPDMNGMHRYSPYNITVSSIQEPVNKPDNLYDNNVNTKWSAAGDGEWCVMDLGDVKKVDSLGISFVSGDRVYKFDILISNDNENWTAVYTDALSCGQKETIEYLKMDCNCRYIKYVGHCSNTNEWNNLSEFAALSVK